MAMLASTLLPPGCAFIKNRSSRQMALQGGRGTCTSQKASLLAAVTGRASVMCAKAGSGRDPQMNLLYKEPSEHNGEVEVLEVMSDDFGVLPECCRSARILILGTQGKVGVHSVYKMNSAVTGDYWDGLALLPALSPKGTIALYGMGAGTTARTIHQLFPNQKMVGFEIDKTVLEASRFHMGLNAIEESGMLECEARDCLAPDDALIGAFSGIAVDLYSHDSIIKEIEDIEIWRLFKSHLVPGGVIIANIGIQDNQMNSSLVECLMNVFEGEVLFRKFQYNTLAIMGPNPLLPDFSGVPDILQPAANPWLTFQDVRSLV